MSVPAEPRSQRPDLQRLRRIGIDPEALDLPQELTGSMLIAEGRFALCEEQEHACPPRSGTLQRLGERPNDERPRLRPAREACQCFGLEYEEGASLASFRPHGEDFQRSFTLIAVDEVPNPALGRPLPQACVGLPPE